MTPGEAYVIRRNMEADEAARNRTDEQRSRDALIAYRDMLLSR